ncbi:thioredoxin family protein [Megamonas funiformis]|uniref:thioredoxin family protein n=1 Tax=Megamonas funiformis TaxID=437897 RepID=UPI003FEE034B
MLVHADANAFNKLLENKGTFVVDFFATWCGPCKMLGAVLEKVAPEYDFDILIIDIDDNVNIFEEYEVMVVPTLLFVKDGEIIHRESGFFSKDKFKSLIDAYLK